MDAYLILLRRKRVHRHGADRDAWNTVGGSVVQTFPKDLYEGFKVCYHVF